MPSHVKLDDVTPRPSAPNMLDQVVYPNDFPSATNKTNLPAGLLLPDSAKTPNK